MASADDRDRDRGDVVEGVPRLSCQEGMATGTSSAASASAMTTGRRGPEAATVRIVMYTHMTNAAARANGSSATNSATRMP